jgi:trans-2,3-dihydro-3-hydroxyanthranilate isomerase
VAQRKFDFIQLDVFTRKSLEGNQLAVFVDAHGLSDGEMQALAREMNLSETTFILPRDADTESREGVKVRIFTVQEELPFAGHPTLGTALCIRALREASGQRPPEGVTLNLPVGKIPVQFTRRDGAVFGEMRQRDPEFGAVLDRNEVARLIGIAAEELSSEWPVQVVSTGMPFAIVPFRNSRTLANLQFSFTRFSAEYLEANGGKFFYFVSPHKQSGKTKCNARMIFYNGEDPATGSAAGCAASWMAKHGVAQSEEQVVIRQGYEMHRASDIYVRARREGDRVTDVRVGGYAAEILRGTVTLSGAA